MFSRFVPAALAAALLVLCGPGRALAHAPDGGAPAADAAPHLDGGAAPAVPPHSHHQPGHDPGHHHGPDGGAGAAADGGASPQYEKARLLQRVNFPYPDEALKARVEGVVILEVSIGTDGHVTHVHVLSGPGHGLNETAASALRASHFAPARLDGRPVPSTLTVRYAFKLPASAGPPAPAAPTPAPVTGIEAGAAPLPVLPVIPRETLVTGERDFTAASSTSVRALDLELRLVVRPSDILKNVPGLITSSHQGGGGKADQYFLRGFDADHGTDVALYFDGVPVNLVSHAHGQGYADFNFLIPELVQRVDVHKGPYYVEYGDFATAGAINVVTRDAVPRDFLSLQGGMLGTYRVLGVASPTFGLGGRLKSLWAAEVYHTDGPFLSPNNLQRYNVQGKETLELGKGRLQLQIIGYGAGWNSSGQIPAREVAAGRLERFGAVDPSEGGSTQRQMVILGYTRRTDDEQLLAQLYYQRYKLALFSNFTLFARDFVNGDQIEQDDSRNVLGAKVEYRRRNEARGIRFEHTVGFQLRSDFIDITLFHDKRRERIEPLGHGAADVFGNSSSIHQENLAGYVQEDITFNRYVRLILGARVDYFNFDVDDHAENLATLGTKTSGTRQQGLVSPKANLVLTPIPTKKNKLEVFLNFGTGLHSNDARVVIRRPNDVVIPRAIGGEVGSRFHLDLPGGRSLDLAAAGWYIYLQSETVFSGDNGVFEPSLPSQRFGIDVEVRAKLLKWLWADFDATFAKAEFTGNPAGGSAIALAPRRVIQAGLTARHPIGLKGSLRLRHIGDRPATQDRSLTALGYTVLDLTAAYAYRWFEVGIILENVINSEWREAQFADDSRVRPTASAPRLRTESAPVTDLHFVPGNPINLRAAATVYF